MRRLSRTRRVRAAVLLAAAALAVTACSGGDGGSTPPAATTVAAAPRPSSPAKLTIMTPRNGQTVRQSRWVDWNFYVDELTFAQAFRTELVAQGFLSSIGMLIDTSRNGWGGAKRPTAEEIDHLHNLAHEQCFIANSVKTEIRVAGQPSPALSGPEPAPRT